MNERIAGLHETGQIIQGLGDHDHRNHWLCHGANRNCSAKPSS
jgi:hypothetical protein